jgi:hypothetical protein
MQVMVNVDLGCRAGGNGAGGEAARGVGGMGFGHAASIARRRRRSARMRAK